MKTGTTTERDALTAYGHELVAAGFHVWLTPVTGRAGYLTYQDQANGCWGTLQQSQFDGWDHLMPIKPSRERGSSMHLDIRPHPRTVRAARQCAQPTNWNRHVGTQSNHPAYLSPSSIALHVEA